MDRKNKWLGQVGLWILFYGLLAYAATRTLNFVRDTMPADQQFLGYLYLLATGVGAIIWLNAYSKHAKGYKQRGIAFAMGIVDLLAELALVYVDTMVVTGENGMLQQMAPEEVRVFVIASVGIIGVNILAGFFYKLFDIDVERHGQTEDFVEEIHDATLRELRSPKSKQEMIQAHLPQLRAAILDEVRMQVLAEVASISKSSTLLAPQSQPARDTVIDTMPCPACGVMNHVAQRHCGRCGSEMRPAPRPAPRPMPTEGLPPLTDAQMRAKLKDELARGIITKEAYDLMMAQIEMDEAKGKGEPAPAQPPLPQ